MQRIKPIAALLMSSILLASCQRNATEAAVDVDVADRSDSSASSDVQFPTLPEIVVPDIVGTMPAQHALEKSLGDLLNPITGISVQPASCGADGAIFYRNSITDVDAQGNFTHVGSGNVAEIAKDGSGSVVYDDGVVEVRPDGSGSIVRGTGDDESESSEVIEVAADGSGSYVGRFGTIELNGRGAGTWTGPSHIGVIENNGDGSGEWVGPQGTVRINADGSGSWVGPKGAVENHGDGTGTVNGRKVAMAPLPPVARASRFPLLTKFKQPGKPCGYVISLNEKVLFDFDKSDLRPEAAGVLSKLALALKQASVAQLEVRGHTDSKGEDQYNMDLSQRRADAVAQRLGKEGVSAATEAKGFGENQPVAPNEIAGKDNPAGRQRNRRVEIVVRS